MHLFNLQIENHILTKIFLNKDCFCYVCGQWKESKCSNSIQLDDTDIDYFDRALNSG